MKKNINSQKIVSPCISICKTDPKTGYCYGCARTDEEKLIWKKENTENNWKKILALLPLAHLKLAPILMEL